MTWNASGCGFRRKPFASPDRPQYWKGIQQPVGQRRKLPGDHSDAHCHHEQPGDLMQSTPDAPDRSQAPGQAVGEGGSEQEGHTKPG